MPISRCWPLLGALLLTQPAAPTLGHASEHLDAQPAAPTSVRRNYRDTSRFLLSSNAIVVEATPGRIMRISAWLDTIFSVPHGRQTLQAILDSGNELIIRHSAWALEASGRTLAPVTANLTNGRGADVVILFDARIPEQGSHWVFDAQQQRIEFTAVQNLFHELAHAKHLTNGTWRYFDSEAQAIAEENTFRQQFSEKSDTAEVPLRAGVDGQQFWWTSD